MKRNNKTFIFIISLILSLSLCACGSSSESYYTDSVNGMTSGLNITADTASSSAHYISGFGSSGTKSDYSYYEEEAIVAEEAEEFIEDATEEVIEDINTTNSDVELVESKLIYKCKLNVETLDYDASYTKLQELIDKYDCFIESENYTDNNYEYYSYRDGYKKARENTIVIRIPSENYSDFLNEESELGNVLSKSSNVENITMQYYDTTTQIEGLQFQLDRLVEMLRQTTEVSDMIEINREITNVENQINSLRTVVRTYDMDVAYSYISINLLEVVEYSEVIEPVKKATFVDRLKNQIVDTWEDFLYTLEDLLFGFIELIPTIVIVSLIILIVIIVNKASRKSNKGLVAEAEDLLREQSETEDKTESNE